MDSSRTIAITIIILLLLRLLLSRFSHVRLLVDGSSIQGILQARVLEWGAIAFSE